MAKHEIIRSRREPVRRTLTVATKQNLAPHMLQIVFHSSELSEFDSPSPDDHIKIILPSPGADKPVLRDFTPRAWDTGAGTLTLEFALHDAGPAAEWARAARPGDTLQIGGPKGSSVVPDDFDWYLLVGDSCALPSIARRLEGLRPGVPVHVFALVDGAAEQRTLSTSADMQLHWLTSTGDDAADALLVQHALASTSFPAGDGYIWIAGEATVSRDLYRYVVDERKHNPDWVKAAAYWTRNVVEA